MNIYTSHVSNSIELKNRKAISAYIAVLFLVGLAVAGGVLLYSSMIGALSEINVNELPQTLSLDTVKIVNSTTCIAYIRNVGSESVTLDKAYIDNSPASSVDNVTINPDTLEAVAVAGTFVSGNTYDFKVVAKDMTQIVFSARANF
jgi:hypothetical protein